MSNERERMAPNARVIETVHPMNNISPSFEPATEPTLGELFVLLTEDVSTLVRKEIELARTEVEGKLKQATGGAVNVVVGGILLLLGAGALIACAVLALGTIVAYWLSALIIGVLVIVIGLILVQSGKSSIGALTAVPEQSIASLKRDTEMIKEKL